MIADGGREKGSFGTGISRVHSTSPHRYFGRGYFVAVLFGELTSYINQCPLGRIPEWAIKIRGLLRGCILPTSS